MIKPLRAFGAFLGAVIITPVNGFLYSKHWTHFYGEKSNERSPTPREAFFMPLIYFLSFAYGMIATPFYAAYYGYTWNDQTREQLKKFYFPEATQRTNVTYYGLSLFMLVGIAATLIGGLALGNWALAFSPVTEWYDLENARQFVVAAFLMTAAWGWVCALIDYAINEKYDGDDNLTLEHGYNNKIDPKFIPQNQQNQQDQNNNADPSLLRSYLQKQGSSFSNMKTVSDFDRLKEVFNIDSNDITIIALTLTPSSAPVPPDCIYSAVEAKIGYLSKTLYKDGSNHIYYHSTEPGDDGYICVGKAAESPNGNLTLTVTKPPKLEHKQ